MRADIDGYVQLTRWRGHMSAAWLIAIHTSLVLHRYAYVAHDHMLKWIRRCRYRGAWLLIMIRSMTRRRARAVPSTHDIEGMLLGTSISAFAAVLINGANADVGCKSHWVVD